ncbi:hypothetical protein, partial [Paenibacillus sp.]|uniref:hypothetical protein n=1 Tax=Paenibacillus sp. TaxID=58172 RepID=UPI0028109F1F
HMLWTFFLGECLACEKTPTHVQFSRSKLVLLGTACPTRFHGRINTLPYPIVRLQATMFSIAVGRSTVTLAFRGDKNILYSLFIKDANGVLLQKLRRHPRLTARVSMWIR